MRDMIGADAVGKGTVVCVNTREVVTERANRS